MILTEFYGLVYGVLNKRAESQQMKKACLKLQGMSVAEIKLIFLENSHQDVIR